MQEIKMQLVSNYNNISIQSWLKQSKNNNCLYANYFSKQITSCLWSIAFLFIMQNITHPSSKFLARIFKKTIKIIQNISQGKEMGEKPKPSLEVQSNILESYNFLQAMRGEIIKNFLSNFLSPKISVVFKDHKRSLIPHLLHNFQRIYCLFLQPYGLFIKINKEKSI